MVCHHCRAHYQGNCSVCPVCRKPLVTLKAGQAVPRQYQLKFVLTVVFFAFLLLAAAFYYLHLTASRQLQAFEKLAQSDKARFNAMNGDGAVKQITDEGTFPPTAPFKRRVAQAKPYLEKFPDRLVISGLNEDLWLKGRPGARVEFAYDARMTNEGKSPMRVDLIFKLRCEETGARVDFNPCYQRGERILGVRHGMEDYFMRFPPQGLRVTEEALLPRQVLECIQIVGMSGACDHLNPQGGTTNYALLLHGPPNNAFAIHIPETARHGSNYTVRCSVVRNGKEFLFPYAVKVYVE